MTSDHNSVYIHTHTHTRTHTEGRRETILTHTLTLTHTHAKTHAHTHTHIPTLTHTDAAEVSFRKGGYYSVKPVHGLRIIVINTLYYSTQLLRELHHWRIQSR